jgi:Signal transduction histidine kinase
VKNLDLWQDKERFRGQARTAYRFIFKGLLQKQFNKNIYTKILLSNVTVSVVSLIAMMLFASFIVKQATHDQLQQDLLRKANRVNFALLQLTEKEAPSDASEQAGIDLETARQEWKKSQILFRTGVISKKEYDNAAIVYRRTTAAYQKATALQIKDQARAKHDLLKFLADLFNARRITVFDRTGNIIGLSAEQEMAPGSKVEGKFIQALNRGEITITPAVDRETRRSTFNVVVPMGNNQNAAKNGILLEMRPPTIDFALSKMHLYLVIGGMAILVVIIFNSIYLSMSISRPISRLATSVAEISRGDVSSIEDQPLDEINVLTGQLNKLAVRMKKIQTESSKMEEERARLFTEISHELRTPLTSIQGFVEAIRDGMVQDKALLERYLDTIYTQTVHITRLVDDLLALGRLESGNITVEKQPLDLITLVQTVITSFEAEANSKNTLLLLEKKTKNAIVIGDVDRMEQIIRNLLKNGIKATENGIIRICVDVRQGEAVLTIKDNGIGIAAEDLPHIWDRFYGVKNQRGSRMQEKGSGLGLVIVKKLVQLQGGSINVESQLGKGTIFHISFPSFDQRHLTHSSGCIMEK